MNRIPFTTLALATTAALAIPAHAAEFKAGDWTLSVGGIVNAFYTHTTCGGSQAITGLALGSQAVGCAGTDGRTIIGNGLLPNALVTTVKGQQDGLDIGATLMIGAATSSADAIANNNNVDVRQAFFTVGDSHMGSFKLGRDYGLFGASAVLGDMTLIGVGAPVGATQRNRVSLGHIGSGYSYLGHYGQVSWAAPTVEGFSFSAGLMSPIDSDGNVYTATNAPQLQAMVSYAFTGGKAWAAAKTQKFDGPSNSGFTMHGVEIGGSYSAGGFGVLANLQSGTGLGILSDADSGGLKQQNLFIQGTFQATPKAKLGLNWGESRIKSGAATDLHANRSLTAGLYYGLTKSVTLSGEVTQTRSTDFAGDAAHLNGIALGGVLFF